MAFSLLRKRFVDEFLEHVFTTFKTRPCFQERKHSHCRTFCPTHHDQDLPLILECNASSYDGHTLMKWKMAQSSLFLLQAVLSVQLRKGTHAHLDKGALAIIFGVKRFHVYLDGWKFSIVSDHRALQHLFRVRGGQFNEMGLLDLEWLQYTIRYKPGPQNANADLFSRLPLLEALTAVPLPGKLYCYWRILQHLQSQCHRPELLQPGTPCCRGWQNWCFQVRITRIILTHFPFEGNYQSMMVFYSVETVSLTHGLPELLVSDNASVFTTAEFKEFLKRNGIRRATSAPYHPSSNGIAERYVLTFKVAMKKSSPENPTAAIEISVSLQNRTVTGVSPAQLLMGCKLRTHLDLMRPSVASCVAMAQDRQKADHDRSSPERTFEPGAWVFVKKFTTGPK